MAKRKYPTLMGGNFWNFCLAARAIVAGVIDTNLSIAVMNFVGYLVKGKGANTLKNRNVGSR
jgi:hypothetical protein